MALKSETLPNGLASVNVATGPVKLTPAIALTALAADANGESTTLMSNCLVDGMKSLSMKLIVPW